MFPHPLDRCGKRTVLTNLMDSQKSNIYFDLKNRVRNLFQNAKREHTFGKPRVNRKMIMILIKNILNQYLLHLNLKHKINIYIKNLVSKFF